MSSPRVPGGVVHKLPGDLRQALTANPTALDAWKDITPLARNEFICWVEDAKQDVTRERRIRRTQEELEDGQRRPVVGLDAATASAPAGSGLPGTMTAPVLRTDRLLLRRLTDGDRARFAEINGDPEVMRYRLRPLTRQESDDLIRAIDDSFAEHGFGQWGIERVEDGVLIGFVGLEAATEDMPFRPLIHIGWHLAVEAWHHGYATEGASAVLDYSFGELGLSEVVAHTSERNARSRAVMDRLGMTHDPADDFDGPWYPAGHPNRRFVVYRLRADDWRARRARAKS